MQCDLLKLFIFKYKSFNLFSKFFKKIIGNEIQHF